MKQRLGIARALVNDPVVVFLDEPTLGLDPRGQLELLELIQRIARERQAGVILCSHLLAEIEKVCDDVVILNLGQVVARGTVAEVIGRVQHNILLGNEICIQVPSESVREAKELLEKEPAVLKLTVVDEDGGRLEMELVGLSNGSPAQAYGVNNKILSILIRAKIPILSFGVKGSRLQDVFLHLTEEVIQ